MHLLIVKIKNMSDGHYFDQNVCDSQLDAINFIRFNSVISENSISSEVDIQQITFWRHFVDSIEEL